MSQGPSRPGPAFLSHLFSPPPAEGPPEHQACPTLGPLHVLLHYWSALPRSCPSELPSCSSAVPSPEGPSQVARSEGDVACCPSQHSLTSFFYCFDHEQHFGLFVYLFLVLTPERGDKFHRDRGFMDPPAPGPELGPGGPQVLLAMGRRPAEVFRCHGHVL